MTALTAEALLADLARLLPPDLRKRAEAIARTGLPPARLLTHLVTKGLLTKFQADAVSRGQSGQLLFGPYVILERIGDGGMGVVFKARHARLDRIDAVKVIRSDRLSSKVVAKRFLREIHLTSSLQHPHIVRAYDAGTVGSQLYLATEFVNGKNLAATVAGTGPLSVADACLVAYHAALALQHIHENNLVHRDVKPSNLLRDDATGSVKLLDLGLSNVHDDDANTGTLTRDGVILGTPDFMAPEQAQNPHGVDIRADLYGLGCTLFFLLTGRAPFDGTPVEKLFKHSFNPPPPLVLPSGSPPPQLAAVVAKLMAKNPDDRYPDPKALVRALLALRPGAEPSVEDTPNDFVNLTAPAAPAPAGTPNRLAVPPRRARWWAVGLAAAVAASGLLLAFALGAFRSRPAAPQAAADESPDELRELRRLAANPAEDRTALRRRLIDYRARFAGAPNAVAAAQLLRRTPSPLDLLPTPPDPLPGTVGTESLAFAPSDDRLYVARPGRPPEEWDPLARGETGRLAPLGFVPEAAASVTADGRFALVNRDGKILVGGVGRSPRTLDLNPSARFAALSPDGKSVVVVFEEADERIAVVEAETGRVAARLDQQSVGVLSVVISPDGGLVAVAAADRAVRLFNTSTGKRTNVFESDSMYRGKSVVAFSADGQKVYVTGLPAGVARYAVNGRVAEAMFGLPDSPPSPKRENLWRTPPPSDRATCVAAAGDGSAVAIGTALGEVRVCSVPTGRPTFDTQLGGRVTALAFSADGRAFAAGLEDGSVHLFGLK